MQPDYYRIPSQEEVELLLEIISGLRKEDEWDEVMAWLIAQAEWEFQPR